MPDNSNNNTYVTQPIYDEVEYLLESDQLETSNGHAEISLDDINDVGSSNEPIRQRCSNLRLFITTVAAFALVMNCLEMYILSIITTLEKQFGLTSFYSGMLISCKELSFALFGAVFSYIAIYTHRPRFLSVMGFIAVFGGILSALPHFVFIVAEGIDVVLLNSSSTADTSDIFCVSNSTDQNDQLDQLATFNRSAYAFLVMSAFIIGFSNCTLTPVAVTYIDDGASPKNNGLYLGIIQCMKPLGPLIAFLGGGFFMKFYTTLNDPGFTSSSPQWIGAWWLGYLVYPAVIFIVALLLLPFPRTPEHEDPQHQYPHRNKEKEYESKAILTVIKAFFLCIYRLCTNHIYMLLLLSSCLNAYLVAGFFPFLPKYIEIQFHQTASVANTITGVMVTFLAGVGILFGGFLVSRLQMKTSQCALVVLFSDVVFIIGILLNMLVKCDQTQYLTHSNSINHSYVALSNTSCLTPCHCADVYSPVCGSDSLTYLSPCHAGCSGDGNETSTYSSCSCGLSSASPGICSSCHALPIYMTLISVAALLGFIAIIPSIVITLRCVQLEDRTVALAFSSSVTNLVSFVPGPMLFGSIIDSTCLRWQKTITSNTPDDHGACMLYDVDAFRVKVHSLTVAFKIAATMIVVILYVAIVRWQKKNGTDRTDRYTDMQDVTLFDITQTDRGVDVGMSSAGGDTGASRTKENSDSN